MLTRFALRTAAVMAIRDRTTAGDRVGDSTVASVDIDQNGRMIFAGERNGPFIDVYTDEGKCEDTRSLYSVGKMVIAFEFGIASTMTVKDVEGYASVETTDGESDTVIHIPPLDRNLEFTLDLIQRQIMAALSDREREWSQMWWDLVTCLDDIQTARSASDQAGKRLAARRVVLTVSVISDPMIGEEPEAGTPWPKFKTLIERDRPDLLSNFDLMFQGTPQPLTDPPLLSPTEAGEYYPGTDGHGDALRITTPGLNSVEWPSQDPDDPSVIVP